MASKHILSEYNISGKFKMIQLGFMTLSLPAAIINVIGITGQNDVYTEEIMRVALTSVVSCVMFMFLSFGYTYYFTEKTANDAYCNVTNQTFTISKAITSEQNNNVDKEEPLNFNDDKANSVVELQVCNQKVHPIENNVCV